MRNTILILVTMLAVASKSGATQADTFRVFFATGVAKLNSTQQAYLDSLLYSTSFGSNNSIRIIGYADEPGAVQLNETIGQNRAQAVGSYLLGLGVKKQAIVQCIGRGNMIRSGNDAFQRRVDIVLNSESSGLPGDIAAQTPAEEKKTGLEVLPTMKRGEALALEGLQFAVSTSEFLPESYPILKKLVEVLKAHPKIKIKIEGHICCGPDPKSGLSYFYELSVERAKHVNDYLVAHKITADRLSYEGFGFSRPRVFPERSERERFRNRRVELRIVSN
jgi:outer membrane protein OmpA-like peptidoglycan-associated protein